MKSIRHNLLKSNHAYSIYIVKSVKSLPSTSKDGRGIVVPQYRVGRILNTYTSKNYGKGRSYKTDSKSNIPLLNRAIGINEIESIKNRNAVKSNYVNKQLFRILRHNDIWVSVYQKLSDNIGSLSAGSDNKTIDGTSLLRLQKIKVEVLSGKFQ